MKAHLLAMLLGILALGAQDGERLVNITPSSAVELHVGGSLDLVGPPKCDASGNIYARS
jgi:hypothetical protein